MSEESKTPEVPEVTDEWRERNAKAQPDPLLGALVETVTESADSQFHITLTVGGTLITGRLVGRLRWAGELVDQYGSGVTFMSQVEKLWRENDEENKAKKDSAEPPFAEFIHLTDARVVAANGLVPGGAMGMFWRGRLNEVQGWSLGTMSHSEPPSD
ncbi:hypothetical protein [Pimelobacter simplex]|uniref:hypothetical protein n=1 Tax=Nocardioides simplex TaxID=2045 RepID=UPI0019323400|nr:hypothetical protein [Pimelobacter simplex]